MKKISTLLFIVLTLTASAQSQQEPTTFSLQQAIDYGLGENYSVKNSVLQREMTTARKGEVMGALLPQVNANADLLHYFHIQNTILEGAGGGTGFTASYPWGQVVHGGLMLPNQFLPNASASQALFDKSAFSLQGAAKANQDIATKNISKNKIDVTVSITKAYYSVLVNEKQLLAINTNLARLDSVYKETNARFQSGLARNIEVSRTMVSLNNMKEQQQSVIRTVALSRSILRYQMNLSESNPLILTDSLHENQISEIKQLLSAPRENAYENRIEYSIIKSQQQYNAYDLKTAMAGHYPRLLAIGTVGYNPSANQFSNLTQSDRWIQYSNVGFRLQVPVFSGFAVNYRVQQKRIQQQITDNNKKSLEKEINLEVEQALINLHNTIQTFNIQKDNLELAQKNLAVLRAEYEVGIALNVEVTTAEADLIQAQTNYYQAVYSALVAKADYDKAVGNIVK